jgi:hypothetical protein
MEQINANKQQDSFADMTERLHNLASKHPDPEKDKIVEKLLEQFKTAQEEGNSDEVIRLIGEIEKLYESKQKESEKTFEGKDPEELLERFFEMTEEELGLTWGTEQQKEWSYCECVDERDGSNLIDMGINVGMIEGFKELFDKTELPETSDRREGQGVDNLLSSLKGKKVISIVTPAGKWYLKVLEPSEEETANTTEESVAEKTEGKMVREFADVFFAAMEREGFESHKSVWPYRLCTAEDGSHYVDMQFRINHHLLDDVVDAREPVKIRQRGKEGDGMISLANDLRGTKVVAIKDSLSDGLFLKIIE